MSNDGSKEHMCYILKSSTSNRIYIGYTVDFNKRLRQHNGIIKGGAKKTMKHRPWEPLCIIRGFNEVSCALRFEYRLQHSRKRFRIKDNIHDHVIHILSTLIKSGDGSIRLDNIMSWPKLTLYWYSIKYEIVNENIKNIYVTV